ncbi:hypothetical protein AAY86_24595 [Pseudomonas amygdali pv. tabaci str. ATCC 11528]|nr:hypothetical protein C1E_0211575 [Pseudomonas amygdali pv. tabaci str. ATCC 11528]KKY49891.1 hypothetical protein AAY86_24595 [Pseudomonas amygdali pv. tabaci str. ATCC 11528]QED86956.1 hypothetical protein PSYTB_26615 [Pseudomonas amygdali pv. tabaci str. ATCC 11528]
MIQFLIFTLIMLVDFPEVFTTIAFSTLYSTTYPLGLFGLIFIYRKVLPVQLDIFCLYIANFENQKIIESKINCSFTGSAAFPK